MAKGKDIAGLAALGTLAYMMGRKQGAAPSTSPEANKPPATTVTPAAVAPPRPVTSNSEEATQAASDAREDMRNDQQVNAVRASAPASRSISASANVTNPISTRPGTMSAYVPRRAPAPMAGSGRGGQGGAREGEAEAYRKDNYSNEGRNRPTKTDPTNLRALVPSEEDTQAGLEAMAGGPGLSAIHSAAKSLAAKSGAASKLKDYVMPLLEGPRAGGTTGPRGVQELRGFKDKVYKPDFVINKKGGRIKAYANGGSVSSRADGIAQRGKTNCKIC